MQRKSATTAEVCPLELVAMRNTNGLRTRRKVLSVSCASFVFFFCVLPCTAAQDHQRRGANATSRLRCTVVVTKTSYNADAYVPVCNDTKLARLKQQPLGLTGRDVCRCDSGAETFARKVGNYLHFPNRTQLLHGNCQQVQPEGEQNPSHQNVCILCIRVQVLHRERMESVCSMKLRPEKHAPGTGVKASV